MTAKLARSRGLDVANSGYSLVVLNDPDWQEVEIDNNYETLLRKHDDLCGSCHWRQDIPGNELADILEAGLVESEGD